MSQTKMFDDNPPGILGRYPGKGAVEVVEIQMVSKVFWF